VEEGGARSESAEGDHVGSVQSGAYSGVGLSREAQPSTVSGSSESSLQREVSQVRG
jgi:hypothetical protein